MSEPNDLFADLTQNPPPEPILPQLSEFDEMVMDYRTLNLSLRAHPLRFLRTSLREKGYVASADLTRLANGWRVKLAGIVTIRQRPATGKGIIFMTMEDETGNANLVVWPTTWETFRPIAARSNALAIKGKVQKAENVIHVVVSDIADLGPSLSQLNKSRDFH